LVVCLGHLFLFRMIVSILGNYICLFVVILLLITGLLLMGSFFLNTIVLVLLLFSLIFDFKSVYRFL
jgi:hypothetical protein